MPQQPDNEHRLSWEKEIFMNRKLASMMVVGVMALGATASASFAQDSTKPADKGTTKSMPHADKTTPQADKSMPHQNDHKMAAGSSVVASDREFIMKAAQGGQMEVMMAEMAVSKATNAEVKQFAQRLLDDHSKANEELKTLASNKGLTLPAENASKTQKMKMDMEKQAGANFDRDYMKDMVKDHQKDIAMFEREARDGKDSEVKAWAEKTLPTLREHLQMARDIAGKVGAGEAGMSEKGRKGTADSTKPSQK